MALCSYMSKHPRGKNGVSQWWSVQLQAGCLPQKQPNQTMSCFFSKQGEWPLPACLFLNTMSKKKMKIWKCIILRPHLLRKLVFLFPLNVCWSLIFFLYCIQQLKCQDHASNFAWDDVLSARYYNLFNNIIICDLKKHFSFQFTQNYSGLFSLKSLGSSCLKVLIKVNADEAYKISASLDSPHAIRFILTLTVHKMELLAVL